MPCQQYTFSVNFDISNINNSPFGHRFQYTSASCSYTDRAQGHEQSRIDHTQLSRAADQSVLLPEKDTI